MKSLILDHKMTYTGTELRPGYLYQVHNLQGNALFSWIGPCDVPTENLIDLEDRKNNDLIQSDEMIHIICEIFHQNIFTATSFARNIMSLAYEILVQEGVRELTRSGDDLYVQGKKLSVSIACVSLNSGLIHCALNCVSTGVPNHVSAASLSELKVDPIDFQKKWVEKISAEWVSIESATTKISVIF